MAYKSKSGISTEVMYDDLATSLVGKRLLSTAGKVTYDYDEAAIIFKSGGNIATANDRVVGSVQYPHAAKAAGKLYPHIHWEQVSTNVVVWTLQYRIQSNGVAKNATWTTMTGTVGTDDVFTYPGSGTFGQITKFKDGSGNYYIDMTGVGISATIQFRLARTDSTGTDILGVFFDFHFEIDSTGSREEYVK